MAVTTDKKLETIEAENAEIDMGEKSQEDVENEVQEYQGTVFDALLAAANYQNSEDEHYLIRINRMLNGIMTVLFKFHIHPLTEEELQQIRKKNTKVKRDRRYGIDRQKVNAVRFRSQIIYEATDEEDRDALWNNKDAWEKLNVLNGIDLIDKVLLAGEKDRVITAIEDISGFGDDNETEELIKN